MTYIYEKYDYSLFEQRFENVGRLDDFGGHEGLETFFNALEQLAEDTGQPIECDPIALCCDFSHYDSLEQYNEEYGAEYDDISDIDELFCDIDGEQFITRAH